MEREGRAWQLPPLPWNSLGNTTQSRELFQFSKWLHSRPGNKEPDVSHAVPACVSLPGLLFQQGCEFQALPAASSKLFLCCPFSPPWSRNKSIPAQESPVASREGALERSARVWDIPAPFPGLPQHLLQAGRAPAAPGWGWHPRGDPQLHGWRLSASQHPQGTKRLLPGDRGCSSSWDAGFAASSPKMSCCSKDFHLQLEREKKRKSCGKPQDFYLEEIFFGCLKFSWQTHPGKGVTLPSSVPPVTQQRSSGLGDPGWIKGQRQRPQSSSAQALPPQLPQGSLTCLCCLKPPRQSFPGTPSPRDPSCTPEEPEPSPAFQRRGTPLPPLPPHHPMLVPELRLLPWVTQIPHHPNPAFPWLQMVLRASSCPISSPARGGNTALLILMLLLLPLSLFTPFHPSQPSCSRGTAPGLGCSTRASGILPSLSSCN